MLLQMGGADSNYKNNVNMSSGFNHARLVFHLKVIIYLFHCVWQDDTNYLVQRASLGHPQRKSNGL